MRCSRFSCSSSSMRSAACRRPLCSQFVLQLRPLGGGEDRTAGRAISLTKLLDRDDSLTSPGRVRAGIADQPALETIRPATGGDASGPLGSRNGSLPLDAPHTARASGITTTLAHDDARTPQGAHVSRIDLASHPGHDLQPVARPYVIPGQPPAALHPRRCGPQTGVLDPSGSAPTSPR
jgi:hypothetical protein